MSERSVEHGTIVIERRYPASPERTFAAWANAAAKARWLGVPDGELELDVRVGGEESHNGTLPDGRVYTTWTPERRERGHGRGQATVLDHGPRRLTAMASTTYSGFGAVIRIAIAGGVPWGEELLGQVRSPGSGSRLPWRARAGRLRPYRGRGCAARSLL